MTTPIPTEAQDALDLEGLRALCENAAPAPWTVPPESVSWIWTDSLSIRDAEGGDVAHTTRGYEGGEDGSGGPSWNHARLIAAARNHIPALLDTIAEQRAEIGRLEQVVIARNKWANELHDAIKNHIARAERAEAQLRAATERIAALEAGLRAFVNKIDHAILVEDDHPTSNLADELRTALELLQPGKPA